MEQNSEFMKQLMDAADIPTNAPTEIVSVSREYYRHPVGTYLGVMGPFRYKFTDVEGKKCEPTDPGASLARIIERIYMVKYFGTPTEQTEKIIFPSFPSVEQIKEIKSEQLYFAVNLETNPKYSWKAPKLFEDFVAPDVGEQSKLVVASSNPQVKQKVFKPERLAFYNGCWVKLEIVAAKSGNAYLDTISLVNQPRVNVPEMNALKVEMDKKIEAEIEARKAAEKSLEQSAGQAQNAQSAVSSVDNVFGAAGQDNSGFDVGDDDGDLPF
jgi:hypothetical protein